MRNCAKQIVLYHLFDHSKSHTLGILWQSGISFHGRRQYQEKTLYDFVWCRAEFTICLDILWLIRFPMFSFSMSSALSGSISLHADDLVIVIEYGLHQMLSNLDQSASYTALTQVRVQRSGFRALVVGSICLLARTLGARKIPFRARCSIVAAI